MLLLVVRADVATQPTTSVKTSQRPPPRDYLLRCDVRHSRNETKTDCYIILSALGFPVLFLELEVQDLHSLKNMNSRKNHVSTPLSTLQLPKKKEKKAMHFFKGTTFLQIYKKLLLFTKIFNIAQNTVQLQCRPLIT